MSTHAHNTRPRSRRSATIEQRPSRTEHRQAAESRRALSLAGVDPAALMAQAETNRWVALLAIPFVLATVFFGAAISSGQEWPIGPAVVFGPILLILVYVYLMLTGDTNAAAPGAAE